MTENQIFPRKLFFFFCIIEVVVAFVSLIIIPTDPKNVIFLGLSFQRLLMLFFVGVGFCFLVYSLIKSTKSVISDNDFVLKTKKFFEKYEWLYLFLLFICWTVIVFPAYRFGKYQIIYQRLQPILVLFFSIILTFLLLLRLQITKNNFSWRSFIQLKTIYIFGGIVLIVWTFIQTTGIGVTIDYNYWGGGATPILPLTLNFSLFIVLLIYSQYSKIDGKNTNSQRIQKLFPIILFFAAITIWNLEPFTPNYFAPMVRPPNFEYYPYSDAQIYDMTAQSLLNGEGYFNRGYVQRPLYGFMLFIFHNLVGQKYLNVIFVQTILYAFFPVMMYFLGKKLFSPIFGVGLGFLSLLRELTAFQASPFMEIVHSKLYMTDNWAGFFALLLTLLFVIWYLNKRENNYLLILIGSIGGLSLLMRINLLFIFIPLVVYTFFTRQTSNKTRFMRVGILLVSTVLILLPWMFRNYFQVGEFGIEPQKFRMVIDSRFEIDKEQELPSGQIKQNPMLMPEKLKKNTNSEGSSFSVILNISRFTIANFLHNEIHSVLIFPNSLFVDSIKSVIANNLYIQENWTGQLNYRQITALIINLFVISLGISVSFKKYKFFGLFPLSIHLFYNLSNGFARVSGWRYVLVTDWAIILYYFVGLVFLLSMLFSRINLMIIDPNSILFDAIEGEGNKFIQKKSTQTISIVFIAIISIGMVLPEIFIQKKYPGEITKTEFIQQLKMNNMDNAVELTLELPDDPNLVYLHTKAFYARYYGPGEGEPATDIEWLRARDTGNLGFMIVNPIITGASLITNESPQFFPHNSDVYIIGIWKYSKSAGKYLVVKTLFITESRIPIFSEGLLTK